MEEPHGAGPAWLAGLTGATAVTAGLASTGGALWWLWKGGTWQYRLNAPLTWAAAAGSALLLAGGALLVATVVRRHPKGAALGASAVMLGALTAGVAWGVALHRWGPFRVLEVPWIAWAGLVPLALGVWFRLAARRGSEPRSLHPALLLAACLGGGLLGGGMALTVRWKPVEVGWFSPYSYEDRMVIGLMRSLTTAQEQWHANINVDPDEDGLYAYALAEELSGREVSRIGMSMAVSPFISAARYLPHDTGLRYHFILYLPAEGEPLTDRNAWGPNGRANAPMSQEWIDRQERYWCAYMWPATDAPADAKVYFADNTGEVYRTDGRATPYRGPAPPPPHAIKDAATESADWDRSPNAVQGSGSRPHDGNEWVPAR